MSSTIGRILTAVRRLDEATTLGGILDALADAAALEGLRVAVLLVDRGRLCVYRHHGFPAGDVPVEVPVTASEALSEAILRCQAVAVDRSRRLDASVAPFLRVAPGRSGLVLPLVVDQSAVALVYSEGADALASSRAPADTAKWTEVVEVLVRHGSARLESVTSQRTVEALTAPS